MKHLSIPDFVASLDQFERNYVQSLLSFSRQVMEPIADYNIPRDNFCNWVGIHDDEYDRFLKGGCNYTVRDISKVQALHFHLAMQEKEREAKTESEKLKFPPYKYSKSKDDK